MEQLTVLTPDQISALQVNEKEQKSNEAFAKLAAIIKYYNDGWEPTPEHRGYLVYSRRSLLLWGGNAHDGTYSGLGYAISSYAFALSYSIANIGARLVIRDYELCKFIAENYEQLYKELWMEEEEKEPMKKRTKTRSVQ